MLNNSRNADAAPATGTFPYNYDELFIAWSCYEARAGEIGRAKLHSPQYFLYRFFGWVCAAHSEAQTTIQHCDWEHDQAFGAALSVAFKNAARLTSAHGAAALEALESDALDEHENGAWPMFDGGITDDIADIRKVKRFCLLQLQREFAARQVGRLDFWLMVCVRGAYADEIEENRAYFIEVFEEFLLHEPDAKKLLDESGLEAHWVLDCLLNPHWAPYVVPDAGE